MFACVRAGSCSPLTFGKGTSRHESMLPLKQMVGALCHILTHDYIFHITFNIFQDTSSILHFTATIHPDTIYMHVWKNAWSWSLANTGDISALSLTQWKNAAVLDTASTLAVKGQACDPPSPPMTGPIQQTLRESSVQAASVRERLRQIDFIICFHPGILFVQRSENLNLDKKLGKISRLWMISTS